MRWVFHWQESVTVQPCSPELTFVFYGKNMEFSKHFPLKWWLPTQSNKAGHPTGWSALPVDARFYPGPQASLWKVVVLALED